MPIPSRNLLKAVLFDMDGVLLDSERQWRKYETESFLAVGIAELTPEIRKLIYGISMQQEYDLIKRSIGISVTYEQYVANYDRFSQRVYSESKLAENLEETLTSLKSMGLKLAIVSASLQPWIELTLNRLVGKDYFDTTISIADTSGLQPKPAPDGYLKAMELLEVSPTECIVIEDSNRGIKSGNAAGAATIATKEFINDDYQQEGYDTQVDYLKQILSII